MHAQNVGIAGSPEDIGYAVAYFAIESWTRIGMSDEMVKAFLGAV